MKHKGFTLIEILVVISIIGFIVTAAVIVFNYYRAQARDEKRVYDLQTIRRAIDMFRVDNGRYPGQYSNGSYYDLDGINRYGECIGDNKPNLSECGNSKEFEKFMAPYLTYIPADPKHNYNCGGIFGGGSCWDYSGNDFYYSYDPMHVCPDGQLKCATLCFQNSESGKYSCTKNNPVCDAAGKDMGQNHADYCIVFDSRQK